ncbi:MAG TPA: hypothetical protein VF828_01810 [Patescibacteria group bacterium]
MKRRFVIFGIAVFSSLLLSACGNKTTSSKTASPTQSQKMIDLAVADRPYISLIPREDGHQLKMKINKIPSSVVQIESELIYTAKDADTKMEIEKGVSDTIKVDSQNIDRDLLLGTASCTNGCKYKYDNGVDSGTLTLTFTTQSGQSYQYISPFSLKSGADLKKSGTIGLDTENFSIKATPSSAGEFFVLIKNYGIPSGSSAKINYSVFSSSSGTGKVTSITPETVTKDNKNQISGDYLGQ